MRMVNKIIGLLLVFALAAAAASASAPKLTLGTDKTLYNWNEEPVFYINNTGNDLNIYSATLQITDDKGVSISRPVTISNRVSVLRTKLNYTIRWAEFNYGLLPAGKYKALVVYSVPGSRDKYVSSNVFVVAPPLILTTTKNSTSGVVFRVTNTGTQPIDLSSVDLQVYTDKGVPVYDPFPVYPSYYLLKPGKSYDFAWGVFGGIPAGTYQAKMYLQAGPKLLVINGNVFTVN